MKKLLCILLFTSLSLTAQTLEDRVSQAYLRQQTKAFVDCTHPSLKYQHSEFLLNAYIKSLYTLDGSPVEISIYPQGRKNRAVLKFLNTGEEISGLVGKKNKFISWNFSKISNDFKQKNQLNHLYCRVEVHRDLPLEVKKNKLHINMHPHSLYDDSGYTKDAVENYFMQKDLQQVVFLDNYDFTYHTLLRDFFKKQALGSNTMNLSLPIVNIPAEIPIVSASAGHAFYRILVNDLEVIYTGGNLNYCILNNYRRLIDQFMQQSDGGELIIKFDLDALMAQKGSWMSGARFPGQKNQSIIVKEAFRNEPFARNFHLTVFQYMKDKHFPYYQRSPLYKTVVFEYQSNDFNDRLVLSGTGKKSFKIRLEYIND